jgi:hypothetical protein
LVVGSWLLVLGVGTNDGTGNQQPKYRMGGLPLNLESLRTAMGLRRGLAFRENETKQWFFPKARTLKEILRLNKLGGESVKNSDLGKVAIDSVSIPGALTGTPQLQLPAVRPCVTF